MIVDDIPNNLQVLGKLLSDKGYRVSFATNGIQALEIAHEIHPDLILLDVMMPGITGFEVCRRLKDASETKDIPVIFVTALKTDSLDIVRGFNEGAADYVTKPFNPAELFARVRTQLALKKAGDELKLKMKALRESEERYRAVVQDQTELVCRFLPDGALTFANNAYCRYFHRTVEDHAHDSFFDIFPVEDHEEVGAGLAMVSREKPVYVTENRVVGGSGEIRWQQWTNRAIYEESGNLAEFQSVGRDITDRVHAEAAYRSLVDYSLQGLAIMQNRRFVFANAMLAEITGYRIDALLAMSPDKIMEMIHSDDRKRVENHHLNPGGETHGTSRYQARIFRKDGAVRHVDVYAAPAWYRGGRCLQLALTDITQRFELESLMGKRCSFGKMIGGSRAMQRIYTLIEQMADTEMTVLITGETGTGKELAAEALHLGSGRANIPLVRVNCAALPENLMESELFGHVRGAFTGAHKDKIGRFEAADGGTLFLDEIGEIPLHLQAKLLRVLEYKEFERVGESGAIRTDARIVAATNVDLKERVSQGTFRKDLFYRIGMIHLHLPPLRDRAGDIPLLVNYFVDKFGKRNDKRIAGVSDATLDLLKRHQWPGNIRELRHAIEYGCSICSEGLIEPGHFPKGMFATSEFRPASPKMPSSRNTEKVEILEALNRTKWHKGNAAKLLGISRSTLYRKLREYEIGVKG